MNKRSIRTALVALALAVSAPAAADWQYAKWGMSPEQVVAASKGKAELFTDKERPTVLARSTYELDDFKFTVQFAFTQRKLSDVQLRANGVTCGLTLRQKLDETYGPPTTQSPGALETTTWRSTASGNLVELMVVPLNPIACLITYRPLPKAGKGL